MITVGIYNVRIVKPGDRYGLKDCLVNDKGEELVEFYDSRYMHTERGQFVSRYYLSTLLERDKDVGLMLDTQWPPVEVFQMREVQAYLQGYVEGKSAA